jgi:DNA-binding beta-propeller fold protein YncE
MRGTRRSVSALALAFSILVTSWLSASPETRAQVVVQTVDLGAAGVAAAVNSQTHRLYVAVTGKLLVYDTLTYARLADIPLPQNYVACYAIGVNPLTNRIYATGFRTYVIDGASGAVLHHDDHTGRTLAVNPATNRVYIGSILTSPYSDPYTVHVLNGAHNTWMPDIPLGITNAFDYVYVAVNPTTSRLYVAFSGDDDLRALDGNTHAELGRLHLADLGPLAVNPATGRIYVRTTWEGAAVVDGASLTQVASLARVGGSLSVNPLTNRIYGVAYRSPGYVVQVADGATDRVIEHVYLDGNLEEIALDTTLGKLFGLHAGSSGAWAKKMTVIQDVSPTSPAPLPVPGVIATADLPEVGTCVALNTQTGRVYVGLTGQIATFDAATLAPLGAIDLTEGTYRPPVYDLAVDEARNRLYAVSVGKTIVINGANNHVVGNLGGGDRVCVNPTNGRVYVADDAVWLGDPDRCKIYNGVTLGHIRTINLGTSSYYQSAHVAVNPTTGYAYCTYSLDGNLRIISPATDDVVQTIDLTSAGRMAVNPSANRLYVAASRAGQSGTLVLDGASHAELGLFAGVGGMLGANPASDRLFATTGTTLVRVLEGASGAAMGRVYIDGGIRDYAVHPGLARLYVLHTSQVAAWQHQLLMVQDSGAPAPTPTATSSPTVTPTRRPWATPNTWLYLPWCGKE